MDPNSPDPKTPGALDKAFLAVVSVTLRDREGRIVERSRSRLTDSPDTVVGEFLTDLRREQGDGVPLELCGRLVTWVTPMSQLAVNISRALPRPVLEEFLIRLSPAP